MERQETRGRRVMGGQYFLYFGVLGMFLPYFNLYCFHLGFSGVQIGILSALRSLAMIVFPIVWGAVADRYQARRPIYILCNFVGVGVWTLYLFRDDFAFMFWVTLVYGILFSPIISFMEAFTMDVLGGEKKRYGRIRAWGTSAFIAVVILLGKLIDVTSIDIIVGLILGGSLLQAFFSVMVPRTTRRHILGLRVDTAFLRRRDTLIFLGSAFLMLVSHGAYYAFFSIHLEKLGYGKTFIGTAWALASVAEILVMLNSDRIFRRFSLENILLFSLIAAVLRWAVLYQARSSGVILASQALHAMTYAAFHIAGILYVDHLTPDGSKTLGQAVNNAVTYGLGMMVGFFLSGWFYDTLGAFPLFLVSALIAGAGGALFMGIWVPARRAAPPER
jgi:PPP family 3-phenylpropionic acid transporter